jgi:uncharacterized protein
MMFAFVARASLVAGFALALGAIPAIADPSPAAIGYAQTILIDIGMKPAVDLILPSMLTQLERDIVQTRPELKDAVRAGLDAIQPEFVAQEKALILQAATDLANKMSESEIKDVAAFYESPTGKKFIQAQAATAIDVNGLVGPWRQQLSTNLVDRLREELKKKGLSF